MSVRFSAGLRLTATDHCVLTAGYTPHALARSVADIENATVHTAVTRAALRLALQLVVSGRHCTAAALRGLRWKEALQR